MNRRLRPAAVLLVGIVALAFADSVLAAYTPRLFVLQTSPRLNGGGQTLVEFSTERTDEATAKVTIYAPAGYRGTISQAPGTQVGEAEATIQANALSPDIFLDIEGTIMADSPSNPRWVAAAALCAPGPHTNVWVLVLTASGRQLEVPVFVDATSGGEATFSSVKMQVCLPPPGIPEASGGAAFGAKVVDALLTFSAGVFTTPSAAAPAMWLAYATPWTNMRPPSNTAGTVQARALVPLPVTITLTVKFDKKRKQAVLSGRVIAAGVPLTGARLQILAGPRANSLRPSGSTGRANQRGAFTARKRITRTTFFQVFTAGSAIADQAVCSFPTTAPAGPAGCTGTVNVSGFSRVVRAVFRR